MDWFGFRTLNSRLRTLHNPRRWTLDTRLSDEWSAALAAEFGRNLIVSLTLGAEVL